VHVVAPNWASKVGSVLSIRSSPQKFVPENDTTSIKPEFRRF